jgi:hypothetical protein
MNHWARTRALLHILTCMLLSQCSPDGHQTSRCRILQRESERDLFALRHPAMASDDDADDDGYDIENDSSDERQLGAGSATRSLRRSESTGKGKSCLYLFHMLHGPSIYYFQATIRSKDRATIAFSCSSRNGYSTLVRVRFCDILAKG